MKHTRGILFGILVCFLVMQVIPVDADVFVLVADNGNGTIYKGSISQGLADLAPLPLTGIFNPVAVDFDPVDQMVYWTDAGGPSPKISKAHLDGSDQRTLIQELYVPAGLALDLVARMVYWTDEFMGHIARIPMDGSSRNKEVIVENIIRPRGIITDHDYRHIYWADSGNNGTIERANLDGTGRTVIVQHDMKFPSGLAINHRENKLYWCDSKLETIERSDPFGYNREHVIDLTPFNGTFFPFDLVLYNDNVYWSDWGTSTLLRVSTDGEGEQHYGPRILQKAAGIHIFYEAVGCQLAHDASDIVTVDPHQLVYLPGQRVIFGCPDGYEFRGSAEWLCLDDFTWSANQAECIPLDLCESSPCVNGGTCISRTAGFSCQCAPGYEGTLCHVVAGCELTRDASEIVTVNPDQLVYLPGQRVIFSCPDGYELQGSAVWFCQSDYTWTESQAECIPIDFCERTPCMNGGTCTSLTAGFTCQCAPGYQGNVCDLAKPGCSRPPPSKHMATSETKPFFQPGEEVLFTCDNDYVIRGSDDHSVRLVCRVDDGSWSGGETECVLSDEEDKPSYAPIIGGCAGVTLIVVLLLIILIFIKRKNKEDERVVHVPNMQTIFQGQSNTRCQPDPPPVYNFGYNTNDPLYDEAICTEMQYLQIDTTLNEKPNLTGNQTQVGRM